jgi:hypothetical protein
MRNNKIALVVPNNRLIKCWGAYANNFKLFNADIGNVRLFVVDDYSPNIDANTKTLYKEGTPFEYWTMSQQIDFFKANFGASYEKYWLAIPHRTDACRSFGYLVAGLWGADVIITFDDDNYPLSSPEKVYDYIGNHDIVNFHLSGSEVSSPNRWFNPIDLLAMEPNKRLFARGFPYTRRSDDVKYTYKDAYGKVAMNIGLWTVNPDVDALTVLSEGSLNGLPKTRAVSLIGPDHLMLSNGTFAPLNTANTAYSRELLPIIYDTFQGAQVGELKIDRFGDIWSNLFIKKILDKMGTKVVLGAPLVEHLREPRDTFVDFQKEFWGIIISEKLFSFMETIKLSSYTYTNLYVELIENLKKEFIKDIQQDSIRNYLNRLCNSMSLWIEIVEKIGII